MTSDLDPIPVAERWIHDGLVHNGEIYFTAVHGEVVVVDAVTREVTRRYDLNELAKTDTPLGWCRGIEIVDENRVLVGFSRLRPTKWKEKIRWAKYKIAGGDSRGFSPTGIGLFDLHRREMCWHMDLEPAGVNAVFSIHGAP